MTVLSDYQALITAAAPLRYWPLTETSGTTATDLIASEVATCVNMTMGAGNGPTGKDNVGGLGGKAPVFDADNKHILLRANKILGGQSAWTVEMWARITAMPGTEQVLYGEMSTSAGSNMIRASVGGPSSGPQLFHTYGSDLSVVTKQSGSVFLFSAGVLWVLLHYEWQASAGRAGTWWNAGQRLNETGSSSSATWTNSSPATWLGAPPRSGNGVPARCQIAHVALYDRILTAGEKSAHFRAGTPRQRELINKTLFRDDSPWRQRLDDANNVPDLAVNSATTVQRLVNQVALYGTGVTGTPVFVATNATPTEQVRIQGGTNNASLDKPALYNALATVPIPTGFKPGIPTDIEASIYQKDADDAYEFWIMQQTLVAPEFVTCSVGAGGSIPVSATPYAYVVYPADGSHAIGNGLSNAATVTTGNQTVTVSWGTSEDATAYRIYRRLNTFGSSGGLFMVEVAASVHSWVDDGSVTPGASSTLAAAAVTTDWGCRYAGVLFGTDDTPGVYVLPRPNWGAKATSLPLIAGLITIEEAYNVIDNGATIDHAMAMNVNDTANTHVYPAQRHDSWPGANAIEEGTRFQLDPTYDVNQLTNPIVREIARAYQIFGVYVTDHSGAVAVAQVEATENLGRDVLPEVYQGKQSYELFSPSTFPWPRMRVIDPAWTLEQVEAPVMPTAVALASVIDDFSGAAVDEDKWTIVGAGVSQFGSQLHVQTHASPYAKLKTKAGVLPFTLTGSSVFVKMPQRPTGASGQGSDQAGMQVASNVNLAICYIQFWTEGDGMLKLDYTNTGGIKTTLGSTLWDPVAHAYQRIREASGIIYAEVSPDGVSWTELTHFTWATTGWPAGNLDDVVFTVFSGNFSSVAGRPDLLIDSVNVVEAVTPPPAPTIRPPGDSRVTNLLGKRTNVMEITAPPGEYTVAATQFGLKHIDLLVGTDVTDITYPAAGTSVQFTITAADGSTVRVMAIGSDHT